MLTALLLVLSTLPAEAGAPAQHRCAPDARVQAQRLLLLHTETDRPVLVEDTVATLPSIANPAAPAQRFDVLQVWGYLYKSRYRIRLLYAQVPGECVLMGQEILEHAKR